MTTADTYTTQGGISVTRSETLIEYANAIETFSAKLDDHMGCLLSSSYEYPNRYKRWDLGIVDPMIVLYSKGYDVTIRALNARGEILLPAIQKALGQADFLEKLNSSATELTLKVAETQIRFSEEERSKQPSVFSVVRCIRELFFCAEDGNLGLYGAFGYDLAFQFEKIPTKLDRADSQRDMVLFLPDSVFVRDHELTQAKLVNYDFVVDGVSTQDIPRGGQTVPYQGQDAVAQPSDHKPGEYADIVRTAKHSFKKGDLFEVVPGQMFFFPCKEKPSVIFNRLRKSNPSPYGFLMNLGEQEYLVGASPEMFVRVSGDVVETCPISGTIARGSDALGDADQIRTLLNSEKDLSELTMCTDVDRNDKSRICVPGSIEVIGRRQIELYSKLIHTVDHVTGKLRQGYDALDAFLSHAWAVTVTGAPKVWAMRFIENHEKSPRRWYGGAVGRLTFDGNINTGLTLRTVRIDHGVAEVRVGATLLYDSIPEDEEAETHLKASALIQALTHDPNKPDEDTDKVFDDGKGKHVVLIDHQDSFVHTLADYFRQTGAKVTTERFGLSKAELQALNPSLVVLSPGPGSPSDFNLNATIQMAIDCDLPVFGVCLGLQGIVEYFGGKLNILDTPQHGKPSDISVHADSSVVFDGLGDHMKVGRYHSLYADKATFPNDLIVSAETADGVIMGIQHKTLPIAAVQFHPESIMTLQNRAGLKLVNNVYKLLQVQ